jgi:hypothetical protein
MSKKLNLSFLIVTLVTVMFIVTMSGCANNDDAKTPQITTPTNEVTEPTAGNEIIQETESTIPEESSETTPSSPICGDNNLDEGEKCDGDVLTNDTCESNGYDTGAVSCTSDCTIDFSECITARIGACTDTDDGMDYAVKGVVTITNDYGSTKKYTDYCRHGSSEGFIFEYYCANDSLKTQDYECPKGCNNNGACYP